MKNLLTENEIRKMMKYANINTLADGFVTRLTEEKHEEEPVEEAYMADDEEEVKEEGMGMMADDEPEMQDDDPMDEPPAVDEPEMDAGSAGDMDVEKLVSDLADVISRHTGVDVEVEDDAGAADMGDDMPADDMPADDMAADAGDDPAPMDEMEHGGMADDDEPMEEGEYKADDDEAMEESQEETLEEVVNMIARRVAKRILTEQ